MAQLTDQHNPSFTLFPVNNNRTAWRPFGLPVIMIVPHSTDPVGSPLSDSGVWDVRIFIEDVPQEAKVAGHQHIGLRYPDRELYALSVSQQDLIAREIDLLTVSFIRNGELIDIADAVTGDLISYTTITGVTDTIEYLSEAKYYDLSNLLIEVEQLQSGTYNLAYEASYFHRLTSSDTSEFLCINLNNTASALFRFQINHPGEVIDEMYMRTPPRYTTEVNRAAESLIDFYRPLADALQDAMDEQDLLRNLNWVSKASPEAMPYLSALLGWDLPYFPESLDQMRRAVLRRTVALQTLKGSRQALIELFKLFGFEILISNLWWSKDGKRLIKPNEVLPPAYADQTISLVSKNQVELALDNWVNSGFNQFSIPLLFRPQEIVGDDFIAAKEGGNLTIDAYTVAIDSSAHNILKTIATTIQADPVSYGIVANCELDDDGFLNPTTIQNALASAETVGYSQILITGSMGIATDSVAVGVPPLTTANCQLMRETNTLSITLNGVQNDQYSTYVFLTYKRQETIVPTALTDLHSNRFDLQVLIRGLDELADPVTLEFAVEFLHKIKAFHSLLNVIRHRIELTEVYNVTDYCVGGKIIQRFDTDIGRQQVPPAIIPSIPAELTGCTDLTPASLGYKLSDRDYRQRSLTGLLEELRAWQALGDNCQYTVLGQDAVITARAEVSDIAASSTTITTDTNLDNKGAAIGDFQREATDQRPSFCGPDGITDYCYKGRVNDELLYRQELTTTDHYRVKGCAVGFGNGVYWTTPLPKTITRKGTAFPAYNSKSTKTIIIDDLPAIQTKFITATQPLRALYNSHLGRLYRNYNHTNSESLHYSNRPVVNFNQNDLLALERPSLEIDKPTCHLPGCRFFTLGNLASDFSHSTWRAKPWDFDIGCGKKNLCSTDTTPLNATLINNVLTYDDQPYSLKGNGLIADLSFSDHDNNEQAVHKIYSTDSSRSWVDLEGLVDLDTTTSDKYIETDTGLFPSASICNTGNYFDFADGYPALRGEQPCDSLNLDRDGLNADIWAAFGLDIPTRTSYGYTFGSGLLIGTGLRFDCGCLIASCDSTEDTTSQCSADLFLDQEGERDWNPDQIDLELVARCDDQFGVSEFTCNGTIGSFLEL